MQPSFIFVVDGGASKTDTELRRRDGIVLARHRAGPCNLFHNAAFGLDAIASAWETCAAKAGFEPNALAAESWISAGLAGLSVVGGRDRFHAAFAGFGHRLLSSDGYTSLVGAFGQAPGALLSIGTGAVGCRFDAQGRYIQLGGWGFPIGDRGGGAWLGRQLVTEWLEHRDGAGQGSGSPALWQYVEDRLGEDRPTILEWLRQATPGGFAALVPGLLWAAESGDAVAIDLLKAAAGHLARLATALLDGQTLPVALAGGLAPAMASYLSAALGAGCAWPPRSTPPLSKAPGASRSATDRRRPARPFLALPLASKARPRNDRAFACLENVAMNIVARAVLLAGAALLPAQARAGDLTFWTWRQEDRAAYTALFEDFTRANPGIHVKFEAFAAENYNTILSTALAGGRGGDVLQVRAYGGLEQVAKAGYLTALDDKVPELAGFPP